MYLHPLCLCGWSAVGLLIVSKAGGFPSFRHGRPFLGVIRILWDTFEVGCGSLLVSPVGNLVFAYDFAAVQHPGDTAPICTWLFLTSRSEPIFIKRKSTKPPGGVGGIPPTPLCRLSPRVKRKWPCLSGATRFQKPRHLIHKRPEILEVVENALS